MKINTLKKSICLAIGLCLSGSLSGATYTKNGENEDVIPLAKLNPSFNAVMPQGATVDTGVVISSDGKVWTWGFTGSGQGGNGSGSRPDLPAVPIYSLENIVKVTGGIYHLLALDTNGDLWGWGQSGFGETGCSEAYARTPCKVLSNIVYMDAGEYFSIALDSDGNVYTFGHNGFGQLGRGDRRQPARGTYYHVNPNLNGEKAVLVGGAYEHAYAVTVSYNGTAPTYKVWGWGDNEAMAIANTGSRTCLGVQQISPTPIHMTALDEYAQDIVYIAGGNGWGEALLRNGDVIGWGADLSLGLGITSNTCSPTPKRILTNVEQLYARYAGSVALTKTSEIYTWGQTAGSAFPMIYGNRVTRRTPIAKPISVGGGKEHIHYITVDGEMYGVGYNARGQTGPYVNASKIDWPGARIPISEWFSQQ